MSLFDLGQVRIEKLIVHEIPRHFVHSATPTTPGLSEVESPLDQTVKNFFREKLAGSLGTAAYEVQLDPATTSPLPGWIVALLSTHPADLVATSQDMANHLHQSQPAISPEGLLTVIQARVENRRAVAILKLEKEEGTRVRRQQLQGGSTLSVDHVRDLMLTGKTKVFKVGLFAHVGGASGPIEGMVCDRQKGYGGTVANFFLERFLGCRLKELPELTTRRFFDAAERFINEDVEEPETKARYQVALAAELGGTRATVSPQAFANTNLETDDRAAFMGKVSEAGIAQPSFAKDTGLVANQLKRIQWSFASGVAVLASPDNLGREVQVEDLDDGRTRLEVTDKLKDQHGHR
ncbi:MAG: nucleoid-associated protein [Actinomycetota bacterium]|nr:nucleoid-associated protein [Actinomycetota bacterium]MDQ6945887.1 nucleoid-associated protein [Actinomycetota bacterium]